MFEPGDSSLLQRLSGGGSPPVRPTVCTHCDHLQFPVESSESHLERYEQLERWQPRIPEGFTSKPEEPKS